MMEKRSTVSNSHQGCKEKCEAITPGQHDRVAPTEQHALIVPIDSMALGAIQQHDSANKQSDPMVAPTNTTRQCLQTARLHGVT